MIVYIQVLEMNGNNNIRDLLIQLEMVSMSMQVILCQSMKQMIDGEI